MNRHAPYFLERLSLGLDADSKTIRRAYARELKMIDQESDLPGFQALREAYETALDWAKHNAPARAPERQAAPVPELLPEPVRAPEPATVVKLPEPVAFVRIPVPEPVPVHVPVAVPMPVTVLPEPDVEPLKPEPITAQPVPDTPPAKPIPDIFTAAENPHALAETVFARLVANMARIVELDMLKDASLLESELRNRLADEELFNITARNLFEARVAYLLFSEYTLENGVLFGAAATVFGWEKDSRRLQPFGEQEHSLTAPSSSEPCSSARTPRSW